MSSHPRPRPVYVVLTLFLLLAAGCSTLPPIVRSPEAPQPATAVLPAKPSPAAVIQIPMVGNAGTAATPTTVEAGGTATVTEATPARASDAMTGTSSSVTPVPTVAVIGQVTYRQRIALQPDAVVEVDLQDVSRAKIVSKQRIETNGAQVPIPFVVKYDPSQIDPDGLYTIRARIIEGGQITWVTAEPPHVITGGAPSDGVEVMVQQAKTAGSGATPTARLDGVVSYLQRTALSPNAVIEVKLQDVSRADAPAIGVASQTIQAQGRQVPIPYSLEYDPASIDPKMTYAVSARITEDGALTWISTTMYPVLTRGAPKNNVEITVERVQ